ncbi:hypothetical protein [Actinopolymorpha sp. B9G3]|uniref:hypothetical protein n=1 Tax=Actinopolymorpha sp. B9G3 TaxID=3158970 RepID=UPI0032D8BE9F
MVDWCGDKLSYPAIVKDDREATEWSVEAAARARVCIARVPGSRGSRHRWRGVCLVPFEQVTKSVLAKIQASVVELNVPRFPLMAAWANDPRNEDVEYAHDVTLSDSCTEREGRPSHAEDERTTSKLAILVPRFC